MMCGSKDSTRVFVAECRRSDLLCFNRGRRPCHRSACQLYQPWHQFFYKRCPSGDLNFNWFLPPRSFIFKMIKISKNIAEVVCRSIYLVQEVLAPCYCNTDARTRRRMHARTHAHAHHQLAATNAAAYQHPSLHVMPIENKNTLQIFEIIEMRASTVF